MTDISKEAVDPVMYLLEKRGLYYRVGNAGYTGVKEEAERYTFDDVACMFPNMDSPNQDGITYVAESDAPEFSKACWTETKLYHREKQIAALQARVEELEYEQSADFDMGRVQGLEEAKAKVEELWACRTCREVADAIEALKEQTDD